MIENHLQSKDTVSDAALVARLYELARELARGGNCDRAEFARIDAVVYGRLAQAYGGGTPNPGTPSPANRLNS